MIQEVGLSGIVNILMVEVMKMMKDKLKDGLHFVDLKGGFEILSIIKYLNRDWKLKIQKVFHLEFSSLYYIGPILLIMRIMRDGNLKNRSR